MGDFPRLCGLRPERTSSFVRNSANCVRGPPEHVAQPVPGAARTLPGAIGSYVVANAVGPAKPICPLSLGGFDLAARHKLRIVAAAAASRGR
jgi:hypothetical protein